jgi:hypothetical protein
MTLMAVCHPDICEKAKDLEEMGIRMAVHPEGQLSKPEVVEPPVPGAAVELQPKEITLSDYKKYMHDFFTRRLKRVSECGHRFDEEREPRTNCEWCWFAYLNMHGDMVKTAHQCFSDEGRDVLERIRGKKFTKFFIRFMATVAEFVAHQKEIYGESGLIQETGSSGGATQQAVQNNEQPSEVGG